jgi:hypothetical protein
VRKKDPGRQAVNQPRDMQNSIRNEIHKLAFDGETGEGKALQLTLVFVAIAHC